MNKIQKTDDYFNIISDILQNKEFKQLGNIEHHGVTRFDHSLKVSYYSYKIAKKLNLDYYKTARAGLLHDFFLEEKNKSIKKSFKSLFIHSNEAVKNSQQFFSLSKKEINIIKSHMFPLGISIPKYKESWIVSTVDKVVATEEHAKKYVHKVNYATNLFILFLINYIH